MGQFGKGCHLQLIDGSGFIFRAFYMAERSLPTKNKYRSDKTPIGAIHFFCNMLLRSLIDRQGDNPPTHAAVVFDHSGKTFRNEIFSDYKAHRPPPPEDLVPQFPLSRDAVRAFNFACLELEGFEADDIIATLATQASEAGGQVTVVSSDKDLMQLVGNGVTMFEPMKSIEIGREQVREKFFVDPDKVIDVQALAGDSTDNIPGAPGIGVKTAALLINQFGDLDTLLNRAEEIKQPKRRQALIDHSDKIRMSRELVTLKRNVPLMSILDDIESLAIKEPDHKKLFTFLQAQEFRTIVKRAADYMKVIPPEPITATSTQRGVQDISFKQDSYECVTEIDHLDRWINLIREIGYVALDTETNSLDEMQASLIGISLAVNPNQGCYIPLKHNSSPELIIEESNNTVNQIDYDAALGRLKPLLEDNSILKIGQNIKFDAKILRRNGINIAPLDDTMLLSYALYGGLHNHSMDFLSQRYLSHKPIPIKELLGSGRSQITFDRVPIAKAVRYAAEDADITIRLWQKLRPKLHQSQVTTVYETLERPLISVLTDMEMDGIKVDCNRLTLLSMEFEKKIVDLKLQIYEEVGEDFNISSPKQLGEVMFSKLKLPGGKRLPRGDYATGAQILEKLAAEGYALPEMVLEFRKLTKLKSTYTDALLEKIHPETGRIHTSYLISGANTGRLASTDPNLQNIPIRTEEGRLIREAFVAEEGYYLLSLDYSQIELRVLAHIADITPLKEAFRAGLDIHAMTASQVFGVPIEDMDPMIRRQAKAINFGVIYGISGFGLARDLKITKTEAQDFIQRYFERFPGIRDYMDKTIESAQKNAFVKTLFGRKIHIPDINEKPPRRLAAERGAINAPIQGSAADIIRRAMVRIPEAINKLPAKMLVQIHDELLFEVRKDAIEDVIVAVSNIMVTADRPAVLINPPLVVDVGYADNWAAAH